jgi:protein-tyrosine phosphatase
VSYEKETHLTHQIYWAKDNPDFNIAQYFDHSYAVIERGLHVGGVLIHCAMGISRSSSIVIAYIMRKFHCGYAWAYNFVKKRRVIISPNFGFSR